MYTVKVASNSNESETAKTNTHAEYTTWEEAVEAAKDIVDHCFEEFKNIGTGTGQLFSKYRQEGRHPFIHPQPEGNQFSALEYSDEFCSVICR